MSLTEMEFVSVRKCEGIYQPTDCEDSGRCACVLGEINRSVSVWELSNETPTVTEVQNP